MTSRKKAKATLGGDARVEELAALVDTLTGLNLELARDMLREYVFMIDTMADLKEHVEREGVVVVTERGGENNRHDVKEESRYFVAYQRLVPKAIATAQAIKKFCKDNAQEAPERDEFDEFINS